MKKILIILLLCTACKKDYKKIGELTIDEPIQITLTDLDEKENLANYVTNFKFLKLKTDLKIIDIDKVVYYSESYYVLDKKASQLMVFNGEGDFINRIGERGNGPGEYLRITDFEIDKEKQQILILSEPNRALFIYGLNGNFVKRLNLDFFVNGFVLSKNNTYVFMSSRVDESYNMLIRTDFDGKRISYNFPFPKNTKILDFVFTGGLHKQGVSNYFTEPTSSVVYDVQDKIIPLYQFNFGNSTWKEENKFDIESFDREIKKHNVSFLRSFYCDTDNVLFFMFQNGKYVRKGYYFKDSGKVLACPFNLEDSFLYHAVNKEVGTIDNKYFVSSISYPLYDALMNSPEANKFKNLYPEMYQKFDNGLADFSEENNPYLFIYEIKDKN